MHVVVSYFDLPQIPSHSVCITKIERDPSVCIISRAVNSCNQTGLGAWGGGSHICELLSEIEGLAIINRADGNQNAHELKDKK